jgi:Rps23 Pro-64 3,4-dihydroxylase Tpa1-like proline 4-hydroxylase
VLLEKVERHVAPRLTELQDRTERQAPMLESLRQELLARVGDQQAQVEQSVVDLASRLDGLAEDMKRLSEGERSSEGGLDQRFAAIEQRLVTVESAEHAPGLDGETLLAAMDERIAPRLAEMRNELQVQLQTQLEERSSLPLEESVRESLSGQLRDQHEALRAEIEAQRNQVQAVEKLQDALKAELAAQDERLQAKLEEAHEGLMSRYEEERAQRVAGLEEQQTRLEAWDERGSSRLHALQERLEDMAQAGIDEGVQRVLEQRIAQMREVISAALQPGYPGWVSRAEETPREAKLIEHEGPSSMRALTAGEDSGLLKEIEAEINDLREKLSDSHLSRLITDAVGSARAETEADHDIEARVEKRLADNWNNRLRAEVTRFEGKVRALTVMAAVGGLALLAAFALALFR